MGIVAVSGNGAVGGSRRSLLSVLLLGLIDSKRRWNSVLTILVNILCLAAVFDFLFRGQVCHQAQDLSFSRVGYVDETSARVVIRAPLEGYVAMTVAGPLGSFQHAHTVTADSDFTATFMFNNLEPDTEYSYTTNATHSGEFRTTASNLKEWALVSTSCIKPFYPYSPFDHGLRIKGIEQLSNYLQENAAEMMLFLGDFIYIDLPIPYGWTERHYDTAYRQVYASKSWRPNLRSLPWVHTYDDHEIINDWSANETGLYMPAMKAFNNYHGQANPRSNFGKTYYTFRKGDVAFFVLDTRRYRSANDVEDGPAKTMLGQDQLADLEHWLDTEKAWKVVVSSVPFTRNWRGPDANDSWSGCMWERDRILGKMKQTDGVVILSGVSHSSPNTNYLGS